MDDLRERVIRAQDKARKDFLIKQMKERRDYIGTAEWAEDMAGAAADAAIAEVQRWRPMETAPRDGTKIDLLYPPPRGRAINCFWHEPAQGWAWRTPTWKFGELLSETEWNFHTYPNMEPLGWLLPPSPGVAVDAGGGEDA